MKEAEHHRWLELIGILKVLQALFFVALGFGLLKLLHRDLFLFALHTVEALHLDPDRLLIANLLDKISLITDHRMKQLCAVVFLYALVDCVEGVGLILEQRWAEYLTLVLTIALLPLEFFKLMHHPNHWTVSLLIANILIVIYLFWLVRPVRRNAKPEPAGGAK